MLRRADRRLARRHRRDAPPRPQGGRAVRPVPRASAASSACSPATRSSTGTSTPSRRRPRTALGSSPHLKRAPPMPISSVRRRHRSMTRRPPAPDPPLPSRMRAVNLLPADLRGAVKAPAPVTPAAEDERRLGRVLRARRARPVRRSRSPATCSPRTTIKQHEADLVALEARSRGRACAEIAALKPYADFASMAQARIATVHDLAVAALRLGGLAPRPRPRAAGRRHASRRSTARSRAERRRHARRCAARSTSRRSSSTAARPTSTPSPALMARLRAVDGVTRVSLAESQPKTAEAAGSDRRRGRRARRSPAARARASTTRRTSTSSSSSRATPRPRRPPRPPPPPARAAGAATTPLGHDGCAAATATPSPPTRPRRGHRARPSRPSTEAK